MLPNLHELTVRFFDSDGGDAIWIRFLGNDQKWHNILVDGGYRGAYDTVFKPVLKDIKNAQELVDLWVVTHIDLDHIGTVLEFIKDEDIIAKESLVTEYWFNHAVFKIPGTNGKIGFKEGTALRTYLEGIGKLTPDKITKETKDVDLFGLKLTLLSPTPEKIALADLDWIEREKKLPTKMGRTESDHAKKLEDFAGSKFEEDKDLANGSSITFLMSFQGIKGLFLADGHPSDIITALQELNYTPDCPLLLSFVKAAHHGSKKNTSPELLKLIKTPVYAFTANGISNKHPDKEALARILNYNLSIGQPVKFLFAANTDEIKALFDADPDAEARYNFTRSFSTTMENFVALPYLPLTEAI